jgi:hypothetical protein
MNNKNSAIFLATVLVAGMIGISSPLAAFGDAYQSAKCDNTNVNINGIDQKQIQQQDQIGELEEETAALNGQEMTPEEALNALNGNGNGEPLLNLERNIVNVCINENDNELDAEFYPFQQQRQQQQEDNTVT